MEVFGEQQQPRLFPVVLAPPGRSQVKRVRLGSRGYGGGGGAGGGGVGKAAGVGTQHDQRGGGSVGTTT